MTWTQRGNQLTLTCQGPSCDQRMTATVRDTDTFLEATQRVWPRAVQKGWTASSTDHLCPRHSK